MLGRTTSPGEPFSTQAALFGGRAAGAARGGRRHPAAGRLRTAGAAPAPLRGYIRAGGAGACAEAAAELSRVLSAGGRAPGPPHPPPPSPPSPAPRTRSRRLHPRRSPTVPAPPARLRSLRVNQPGGRVSVGLRWASAPPEAMPSPEKSARRVGSQRKSPAFPPALGKRRGLLSCRASPKQPVLSRRRNPGTVPGRAAPSPKRPRSGQGPTNTFPAFGTPSDGREFYP